MRALYIAFENLNPASGISKKIVSQFHGFQNNGVETFFLHFKKEENTLVATIDDKTVYTFGSNKLTSIVANFKFKYIYNYIKKNAVDFIYIRYIHFANPHMISFLKKLKKDGIRIVIEVPTFPYDDEYRYSYFFVKILHYVEIYSRRSLKKYVDKVATVQDYDFILGIPTVKISNGIDVDSIFLRKVKPHKELNLLGIANVQFWHGYDRVISGMGEYYKNGGEKDIHFYIVGKNDSVIDDLKRIACENAVEERVHFEGAKHGKELDSYFNISDIGIGGLGAHRKGIYIGKALKCVEYAARGIPFIYSDINSDFDNCPFIKRVSQDDTPIDVNELLVFLEGQTTSPEEIRQYVADNLTWDIQMKKVLDEIS